ncbi:hypothetical protein DP145_09115 [Clostridium tetani]|uniref:hypothetical protein n=1 Tax=Clostridium tetani TaxID=1513 RepID=UPI00100AC180|nr:hypothetical protein [Clostridium tetani]RXM66175.1 hypothetical protein DP145_09115 [Clostridium tetani]
MKNKRFFILLIILPLVSLYFYYAKSNKFVKTYTGIKCRINDEIYEEKVLVKFEGKYKKKPFSNDIFKGNLLINDTVLNDIELEFHYNHQASIRYDNNKGDFLEHYRWIAMDKDKDYLTILLPEIKEDNADTSNHWQYKNGLIISAPANTKKEAIENANKLLYLKQ